MNTVDNLKEAFAGESQANQKYRAFAKRAEKDGFKNIAKLFRTTAEAERIHAEGHLKALDMIASTAENLQGAIDGETFEFSKMYPPMLEQANAEGHKTKTIFRFPVFLGNARFFKFRLPDTRGPVSPRNPCNTGARGSQNNRRKYPSSSAIN